MGAYPRLKLCFLIVVDYRHLKLCNLNIFAKTKKFYETLVGCSCGAQVKYVMLKNRDQKSRDTVSLRSNGIKRNRDL